MTGDSFEQKPRSSLENFVEMTLAEGLPIQMGVPDWTYRDLPKMSPEFFDKFVDLVGEDNIKWITGATYPDGAKRGQILISPAGMDRIKAYNKQGCG